MANRMVEASVGAAKVAAWSATNSGKFIVNAGEEVVHRVQPGYLPPETVRQQAVLKKFEGRLGIACDFIDEEISDGELEDRAYMLADEVVDHKLADQLSAVELRFALPDDALSNPVLGERRQKALDLLQLAFEEDHNVMAIPNSHPIIPSQHMRSRIDTATTWRAFAPELDGLSHQFRNDRVYDPAMVAITGYGYERTMFGSGDVKVLGSPKSGDLLALEHAGERPEDNALAWLGSRAALADS